MEGENQGMGLKETISTSTLLATSTPNDIDVHLEKNTEYGAAILLGASDYGKQGSSITARSMNQGSTVFGTEIQASSTGNVYGIYELSYASMNATYKTGDEWVAGTSSALKLFGSSYIDKRYYDNYGTSASTAKLGDATKETANWHGSINASWFSSSDAGFVRGRDGVFSYTPINTGSSNIRYGRPVVVVGDGF